MSDDARSTLPAPLRSWFVWRPLARWVLRGTLVVVALLVVGNGSILVTHAVAHATAGRPAPVEIEGLHKLREVDAKLWRGNAPDEAGYRGLAAAGVTDVVDLRAERDLDIPTDLLDELGLERHALPIRDGQTPPADEVDELLRIVKEAEGRVYVHCGAGVGRTGVMVAAYLVTTGQATPTEALAANLAVGPPSVEQIWYAAGLGDGVIAHDPPAPITWASRVLDAPRRLWSVARR